MTKKTIFLDISSLPDVRYSPTGISRVTLTILEKLVNTQDYFRDNLKGYKIYSSQQIKEVCPEFYKNIQFIPDAYDSPLNPKSGDILLLLGEQWDHEKTIPQVLRLKSEVGVKVITLVHDLIPFIFPEVYQDEFPKRYKYYLDELGKFSDKLLVPSESSKNDLIKYLGEDLSGERINKISLGSTIGGYGSMEVYDDKVEQLLEGKDFILFVSSIVPRKNHLLLMFVWRSLLAERGDKCPFLVFAGKHHDGRDVSYITNQVIRNPALASRVLLLDNANDATIQWLYKNCSFTTFPSMYEGWGLPIAESLSYGKFCLASNSSSMPEVGGDFIEYFSPYDSGQLKDLVCKYLDNDELLSRAEKNIKANYIIPSWDDCASQILDCMKELA